MFKKGSLIMRRSGMLLAAVLLFLSGCGGEGGNAKKAGQAVGETLTDFASGVGTGVDKRMEVSVELSEELARLGLSKTVSKSLGVDGTRKGVTVYFISQKATAVNLVAKALNADDQEIGRSTVAVDFGADDAKYVTFHFDAEMDSQLVHRYTIDAQRAAKPAPSDSTH